MEKREKIEIFNVSGAPGGTATLVKCAGGAALLDSGYSFAAPLMIEKVRQHLGGQPLDYVLLTHTHYDHCSGSVYCRDIWPDVQVVGSEYAQKVFTRAGAIATIRQMNEVAFSRFGSEPVADKLESLAVDIALKDGQSIFIGEHEFIALETPGHTRCSMSYYCAQEGLLLASETTGTMPSPPMVTPCYMTGYQVSIDAIVRCAAFGVRRILIPHCGLLEGEEECADYFRRSLEWAVATKDRVIAGYHAGQNKAQLMDLFVDSFYTPEMAAGQPREAFMLNASYVVPMLIRECLGEEISE